MTTNRPGRWQTPLGVLEYHHVKPAWLHGYQMLTVATAQQAHVALPEKALLDLVYLQPGGDDLDYLAALRLQALDRIDCGRLARLAAASRSPKLRRGASHIISLAQAEAQEFEPL